MLSINIPTISAGSVKDSIDHMLNWYSHSSNDVENALNILVVSGNESEWFFIIEDCLKEFEELMIEQNIYPCQNVSDGYNAYSPMLQSYWSTTHCSMSLTKFN